MREAICKFLSGLVFTGCGAVIGLGGNTACGSNSSDNGKETTIMSDASTQPAPTNRLINATSPYLLQHAHNPVDWFPWGEEALSRARNEDKPVFLSIGYAACHWCHVMEHESFENEEIAAVLNEHFVSIKVDREERPDLDEIYMRATMIYNQGHGGWPMSVFLTPDGKPFFAGTYFPPDSKYGRPGFKQLLEHLAELWKNDRERVMQAANGLTDAVQQLGALQASDGGIPHEIISTTAMELAQAFDPNRGGLLSGQTNKFPPSMTMSLMLRAYKHSVEAGDPKQILLDRVELTLHHMAAGGIYDHLGGGIARYSTDPEWLVPHFEKMLYDQALVSRIYLEGYRLIGKQHYADVAEDIFEYVLTDLQSPEGGFYSTRDADSEGVEGKYYVWSKQEAMDLLGPEAGKLFCSYYDVSETGNWEGKNILNVPRDLDTVAKLNDVEPQKLEQSLAESRKKLLEAREQRVPPGLDDKVLTSWNGLMIGSLARGTATTGDPRYAEAATRAADFVLSKMQDNGRLLRTYRDGKAHVTGYLEDYSFFVEGLLELYEATFDFRWLEEAIRLNDQMIEHFWDEAEGGFYFTADDAEELLVRPKDSRDGATPSGNSVALMNLVRLGLILDRDDLRDKAEQTMRAFAGNVRQQPYGYERLLAAVDFHHSQPREIVIVGASDNPATRELIDTVRGGYHPNQVVLLLDPLAEGAAEWQKRVPLLRGKTPIEGKPAVYVCRNYTCKRPVTTTAELEAELQSK